MTPRSTSKHQATWRESVEPVDVFHTVAEAHTLPTGSVLMTLPSPGVNSTRLSEGVTFSSSSGMTMPSTTSVPSHPGVRSMPTVLCWTIWLSLWGSSRSTNELLPPDEARSSSSPAVCA